VATEVTDNIAQRRYELHVDGELAGIETYRIYNDTITFIHTEVFDTFSGRGLASHLIKYVLDDARVRGLRVVPRCPLVAAYIERHPEYQDLVDSAA
jgi:predicted GNAT family acetyltransferase